MTNRPTMPSITKRCTERRGTAVMCYTSGTTAHPKRGRLQKICAPVRGFWGPHRSSLAPGFAGRQTILAIGALAQQYLRIEVACPQVFVAYSQHSFLNCREPQRNEMTRHLVLLRVTRDPAAQPQHRGGCIVPYDVVLVIQHRRNHFQQSRVVSLGDRERGRGPNRPLLIRTGSG
jgi:hypothetical protein